MRVMFIPNDNYDDHDDDSFSDDEAGYGDDEADADEYTNDGDDLAAISMMGSNFPTR